MVNIEARCVPTKDILDKLGSETGKLVVYDCPIRTYSSIFRPNDWRKPGWWASNPSVCPGIAVRIEGNTWRVGPRDAKSYDPSLTEAQIAKPCLKPAPRPSPPSAVAQSVDGAILIVDGHYVPGPYGVETVPLDERHAQVLVNGLVLRDINRHAPVTSGPAVPPELPESGQFEDFYALLRSESEISHGTARC